jgi:Co-chaperonin GroES (HSP10)
MELRPLADRVVLKQVEAEEITKGGIILTSASQERPEIFEVVVVGPGGLVDGSDVMMELEVGDRVIMNKYSGTTVTIENVDYTIVKQGDILAVVV